MKIELVKDGYWFGISVTGSSSDCWEFFQQNAITATCPCGISVSYSANEIPKINTKHPCNNDKHWTVVYHFEDFKVEEK